MSGTIKLRSRAASRRIIRWLEQRLSVKNLYRVLMPLAWTRAAVSTILRRRRWNGPLPECLQVNWSSKLERRARMNSYLSNMLECFPERLAGPKWAGRCQFNGLERLQEMRQARRPVILVFAHFGPYWLLRTWLRSRGMPVASIANGKARDNPDPRSLFGGCMPIPEIPVVFYQDQLRETAAFVSAGNPLGLAIDNFYSGGKQMMVPFCEGWNFQMTTGMVRMGIRHGAELIPCTLIDEGGWRYRVEMGRPVPAELLTEGADWAAAGEFLLEEMRPYFLAHPENCRYELRQCLQKIRPDEPGGLKCRL